MPIYIIVHPEGWYVWGDVFSCKYYEEEREATQFRSKREAEAFMKYHGLDPNYHEIIGG